MITMEPQPSIRNQNICVCDAKTKKLYIDARYSGISHTEIAIDGITLTRFEGTTRRYVQLDALIKWHENEVEAGDLSSKVCVETLTKLREVRQEPDTTNTTLQQDIDDLR